MPLRKRFTCCYRRSHELNTNKSDIDDDENGRGEEGENSKLIGRDNADTSHHYGTKLVYFACEQLGMSSVGVNTEKLITDYTDTAHSYEQPNRCFKDYFLLMQTYSNPMYSNKITYTIQIFTVEKECIEFIKPVTTEVFVVIDGVPPTPLMEGIEPLKQIDFVFFYTPQNDAVTDVAKVTHGYLINLCETEEVLIDSLRKSCEELDKQTAAFSIYNRKGKSTRDLSKEAGSFLFFQLLKNVLKNMPKTTEAKKTMFTVCRNYYRGNLTELKNIDDFDLTYKSVDAIPWYTKKTFIYKLINKALRIEDVDVLYQLCFYIMDLSEQLELKFQELKAKQKDVLKLYRAQKLSPDDAANFQNSIGNSISISCYLSTTSEHSVAYGFATKSAKREDTVRALFEYTVDLNTVQNIVIADIGKYSAFPEEAEHIFDFVHAIDQGAVLFAEYLVYHKRKIAELNIVLMLGNLLLEMDEYFKVERYFDNLVNSSNPSDEQIVCIFFNFDRTYRLKGDFVRAINYYNRANNLHLYARPKRLASAGKNLNGLGVVYMEPRRQLKAEEFHFSSYFIEYDRAKTKFTKAKEIYNRALPPGHPKHALPRVNFRNVYLSAGEYTKACSEYESALKLQEASLLGDHPDIGRKLHNLAVVHTCLGNMNEQKS
ncbi:unnamed protein product [Rotaria socialis]|uniref:Uncharacterized protein n=2 Tax=Rotaria socialis TaxID=392032 RepID=A0A818ISS1_9BILA|nr:unnamed protein product [Rotaria socialis]